MTETEITYKYLTCFAVSDSLVRCAHGSVLRTGIWKTHALLQ